MIKFIKWTGIVLGSLIGLAFLAGLALYPVGMKKLTQTYPGLQVEAVNVPTDHDAVARGKHVSVVWACTKCHGPDLSGALITTDPITGTIPIMGAIPAPNLTSGRGGVARSYTDTDWIRAIRHGVKPGGQVEIFMYDYSTMSDRDLGDLIRYLKQVPPVDMDYPAASLGPILPIAPAVGIFTPAAQLIDHNAPRPANPTPGVTLEYGKYISGLCTVCHGASLAGKLKKWKQDEFVHAIQTGILPDGKRLGPVMSTKTFSEMNNTELAALWLYFMDVRR